ncbi:fungal specific transcription factor domain-containing protein [Sporobolomyces salmoneus]|uniref:fungal specific transcription factor domain-containing protein n=1 Tax=Sporobolomyces salmoneus TaxID=183962 RepID=UPI00316EECF1
MEELAAQTSSTSHSPNAQPKSTPLRRINALDRLQRLVNVLVDARLEPVSSPSTPSSSRSLPSVSLIPPAVTPRHDSTEEDLAGRLFNLTISSFSTSTNDFGSERIRLIEEAEKVLAEDYVPQKSSSNKASPSFPLLRQAAPSLGEIMARLPNANEAAMSEKYYWSCTSWFFHPLPEYVYRRHKEAVYSAYRQNEIPDPIALAIVLAVIGIGTNCRHTYTRTGGSQEELRSARDLIELSTASLSQSNFLEEPTLDTIRALSLLAIFHLSVGPGDEGTLGFAFTASAVQASFHIKLHRDPSQLNAAFSFREAEERRSLIHHVHLLDGIATASYSRGYILLHARDISAAFPLDLHDHELEFAETAPNRPFEETVLTSLIERFKISRWSEGVTEEILSGNSLPFERMLELDRGLEELSGSIHPLYQWSLLPSLDLANAAGELRAWRISIVWIAMWREKLRLHRPFLKSSYSDPSLAYSRHACIEAAKGFLAIHACPANLIPAAGFTNKACLACIILALEIVFNKEQTTAAIEYRTLIEGALERLTKFEKISTIARRGVKIVRFLLEKAHDIPIAPPPAKRSRSQSSSDPDLSSSNSPFDASPTLAEAVAASDFLTELGLAFPPSLTTDSPESISYLAPSSSSTSDSFSPSKEVSHITEDSGPHAINNLGFFDSFESSLLFSPNLILDWNSLPDEDSLT